MWCGGGDVIDCGDGVAVSRSPITEPSQFFYNRRNDIVSLTLPPSRDKT
jgi:hypothetical protein